MLPRQMGSVNVNDIVFVTISLSCVVPWGFVTVFRDFRAFCYYIRSLFFSECSDDFVAQQ